jgi:hypothetical protein
MNCTKSPHKHVFIVMDGMVSPFRGAVLHAAQDYFGSRPRYVTCVVNGATLVDLREERRANEWEGTREGRLGG